jgi:hypothetical protein
MVVMVATARVASLAILRQAQDRLAATVFTTARLTAVIAMPDGKTVKPTAIPAKVILWVWAEVRVLADKVQANRAARNAASAIIAAATVRHAVPASVPAIHLGAATMVIAVKLNLFLRR